MARDLIRRTGIVLLGLAWTTGAVAQALRDPTRPAAPAAAGAEEVRESPLQSVLLSTHRKAAIIDGQLVPLGGRYGEARLVRVTPTEVTLRSGQSEEVLKLYSGVEKTPAARPGAKRSAHTRRSAE